MTSVFIVELLSGNKVNVAYLTDWSHFSHKVNTNIPYTSNHKKKRKQEFQGGDFDDRYE